MDALKRTPLYEIHVRRGGKMIDFGGWELPVHYTSILDEHKAVRERAGLFDVSHMGEIWVRGKGAFAYLQRVLTNDITSMTPGRCRYSPVCYENGGTVDDILVCKYSDENYLLVVNAANTDKDYDWFLSHIQGNMQLVNESAGWAQLALQGPLFEQILKAANTPEIPEKYYTFLPQASVGGVSCMIARTGYTGEAGVELYCKAGDAVAIYNKLMAAGEVFGLLPCGLGARDTLRFEASMPLYGHELSPDITPLECGLQFAVKLEKEDFIGLSALKAAAPRRVRIGLKLVDKGIAREHSEVFVDGAQAGFVTSGGVAPTLGGNYAMALVDSAYAGTQDFEISVRGRNLKAVQVPMPFYKRAK